MRRLAGRLRASSRHQRWRNGGLDCKGTVVIEFESNDDCTPRRLAVDSPRTVEMWRSGQITVYEGHPVIAWRHRSSECVTACGKPLRVDTPEFRIGDMRTGRLTEVTCDDCRAFVAATILAADEL